MPLSVTVINSTGKILEKKQFISAKRSELNVTSYPVGDYWLVIRSGEKGMTRQILITK